MPAPLIGKSATKSDTDIARTADAQRRETSIQTALDAFKTDRPVEIVRPRTASGRGQLISLPKPPAASVKVKKADPGSLHHRTKAVADRLPDNATRLLDLIVKADEAHHGAQLIEASVFDIASALGISIGEADEARKTLERGGFVRFFDNHSGDRGFRPTL